MPSDRGPDDGPPETMIADRVRGLLDDAPEAARGAIDTALDLYRRGALAVTRTAGDNGALMLLAGGAALTGLSWLLVRAARGKTRA